MWSTVKAPSLLLVPNSREDIVGKERDSIYISLFSWAPKSLWMVTAAIKLRHLLLGRKTMTNLGSMLKSRGITLPIEVHLVKVVYECESWTKKVEY